MARQRRPPCHHHHGQLTGRRASRRGRGGRDGVFDMRMGVGCFHALPPTYFEEICKYPVSAHRQGSGASNCESSYSYSYSISQLLVIQLQSHPRVRERVPLRCVRVRFWVPQCRCGKLLRYSCIPPSQRPSAFSAGVLPIQTRRPFVVAQLGLLAESRFPSIPIPIPIPTPIVPLPDLPAGPKEHPICSLTHQKGYLVGQPGPWAGSRLAGANLNDDTTAGGIRPASPRRKAS
jgi:hypothetical protein